MYTRLSGICSVSVRTCRVPSISCFFASLVSPDGPVMVTTGMDLFLRSGLLYVSTSGVSYDAVLVSLLFFCSCSSRLFQATADLVAIALLARAPDPSRCCDKEKIHASRHHHGSIRTHQRCKEAADRGNPARPYRDVSDAR